MILGDTDGLSISDYFDKFVDEWKAQGGEKITAEVKEALNGRAKKTLGEACAVGPLPALNRTMTRDNERIGTL